MTKAERRCTLQDRRALEQRLAGELGALASHEVALQALQAQDFALGSVVAQWARTVKGTTLPITAVVTLL